jgi:TusA-related sulfurtransferase
MVELDIRGKGCPDATSAVYPVLRDLTVGDTLLVISDYPPARQTVPALARQFGCQVEVRNDDGERFTVVIQKPAAATPA